jgi:hypothetical protein
MGITIISCNKEKVETNEVIIDDNKIDEKIEYSIGRNLAININNINTQKLLINEFEKEWGGDYQVLFKDLPNELTSMLQNNLDSNQKDWIKNHPKLRLLATENTISNLNNGRGFVVVIEPEKDDVKKIVAFDNTGDYLLLNSETEPNLQIIVLGVCEICDEFGDVNTEIRSEPIHIIEDDRGTRYHGNPEKITYIKTPNLSAIEKWWHGKPELRIVVKVYNNTYNSIGTACDFIITPKRSDAKSGYNTNLHLFNWWFLSGHGPDYFIQTFEEDKDGATTSMTYTVTGSNTSTSGTISYQQKDIKLYGQSVSKLDQVPFAYNSSSYINFTIDN